jgi:hypothetical protein
MSTEKNPPATAPGPGPATERSPGTPEDGEAERRADLEEDRRRQEDWDYGELGGEA